MISSLWNSRSRSDFKVLLRKQIGARMAHFRLAVRLQRFLPTRERDHCGRQISHTFSQHFGRDVEPLRPGLKKAEHFRLTILHKPLPAGLINGEIRRRNDARVSKWRIAPDISENFPSDVARLLGGQ